MRIRILCATTCTEPKEWRIVMIGGYRFYFCNPASITHTSSPKHVFGYAYLGVRMLALYERLEDKASGFAKIILKGGSYNIMKSFRRLPRLGSYSEVRTFYNMFDSHIDRKALLKYRRSAYCWSFWTKFSLKHRMIATYVSGCVADLGGKEVMKRLNRCYIDNYIEHIISF